VGINFGRAGYEENQNLDRATLPDETSKNEVNPIGSPQNDYTVDSVETRDNPTHPPEWH